MDVILAVHIRFCRAIRVGDGNDRRHILEVAVCVHFDLSQSAMRMPNLEDNGKASRTQLHDIRSRNYLQISQYE